jgi:hypothetical protein
MEAFRLLERDGDGARLEGGVVVSEGAPFRSFWPLWIEYEVRCDAAWRTRRAVVRAAVGAERRDLTLERGDDGRWKLGGEARPELEGCVDVDLGFTPSTNTLPIRRLLMNVGESATVDAAWVEFPSLSVRRLRQRYTRLGELTYRYENPETGFASVVEVDSAGLVVSYPPGWERIRDSEGSPLFSEGPSAELGEDGRLYAGLIGSWEVEVIDYDAGGNRRTSAGEWHFGWALEGRAVEDVFIVPKRAERRGSEPPRAGNRYGASIRYYDPAEKAWRLVWINPVTGASNSLVARKEGDAIVQEGLDRDGARIRWSFVAIERDRFHWVGEESVDGGATWRKGADFFGRRRSFMPLR